MNAIEKTDALKRMRIPVEKLFVNDLNPNEMSDTEFNLLYDNIERTGLTDPLLVRPVGDKYRIVGGAHRYEVCKLLGFAEIDSTIIDHPDFDEDAEKFQIVRMNVIRGKMTPDKFMKLYESLGQKYADDILKDAFGFADEQEFRKMLKDIEKNLPADMKEIFKEASAEIKTVDDLSKLLNGLFSKYGDTMPYGYMLIDFGGKDSVWLRMSEKTKLALYEVGSMCIEKKRTVDHIIGGLVQLIASGGLDPQVQKLINDSPEVSLPTTVIELPTEEFLDSLK